MTTTAWIDGQQLLARREFAIFKDGVEDACPEDEVLQELAKEEDLSKKSFSVRFAVAAGADRRLNLELQGLPASEATLLSKPAFIG